MVATISADIVNSTSLETEQLIQMRRSLYDFFDTISKKSPGFWGRIVRGDCIECYVPNYPDALKISLLIKLYVKMIVGNWNCSSYLKQYGIRYSIGIGDINYADKRDDIIDGPAIYISGRNLDAISRERDVYSCIGIEKDYRGVSDILNSYVAMIDGLVNSYSLKQAEVVFYKLQGFKEMDIVERVGVNQSSVNSRSTLADWNLLGKAIKDFENFNFEGICG